MIIERERKKQVTEWVTGWHPISSHILEASRGQCCHIAGLLLPPSFPSLALLLAYSGEKRCCHASPHLLPTPLFRLLPSLPPFHCILLLSTNNFAFSVCVCLSIIIIIYSFTCYQVRICCWCVNAAYKMASFCLHIYDHAPVKLKRPHKWNEEIFYYLFYVIFVL